MKERQREGIADAKAAGRYKGRKPTARAKAADAVKMFRDWQTLVSTCEFVRLQVRVTPTNRRAALGRLAHD
jgi:DNA invertase Pin-like site-specific DNA recombinase